MMLTADSTGGSEVAFVPTWKVNIRVARACHYYQEHESGQTVLMNVSPGGTVEPKALLVN